MGEEAESLKEAAMYHLLLMVVFPELGPNDRWIAFSRRARSALLAGGQATGG